MMTHTGNPIGAVNYYQAPTVEWAYGQVAEQIIFTLMPRNRALKTTANSDPRSVGGLARNRTVVTFKLNPGATKRV